MRAAAAAPIPLTTAHAELQIGIGTACDWTAWATSLRKLDFTTAKKRNSPRSVNYLESTRFTYVWTAANAFFSRDQVLSRLSTAAVPSGEFDRFTILYSAAALSPAEEAALLAPMHRVLQLTRTPQSFPWAMLPSVRIIDLVHFKYTPDIYKNRGLTAQRIGQAANRDLAVTSLDLPTLIYATRNWIFHGALVDSSFRGSPADYCDFVVSATDALATIIGRAARTLYCTM